MKCPTCSTVLVRVLYEGRPVFRCDTCFGYLVGQKRVDGLKASRGRPADELMKEAATEAQDDTESKVRCPRCRIAMAKRLLKEPASFHIDTCKSCELVWFDGGELARLQLAYEISPQGQEAAELQRRHREMTPEDRAEFEQNLANLPEAESPISGGFWDAVSTVGWRRRGRRGG